MYKRLLSSLTGLTAKNLFWEKNMSKKLLRNFIDGGIHYVSACPVYKRIYTGASQKINMKSVYFKVVTLRWSVWIIAVSSGLNRIE